MDNNIEISRFGNLLMFKKGYSPSFIKKGIEENRLNGLMIFDHLDPLMDLDFLNDCSFLKGLSIATRYDYGFDFLKKLTNLILLSINTYGNTAIDLSCQDKLEKLSITWRQKKIKGLDKCKSLRRLSLVEYKEADLVPVSSLKELEDIVIKTASLKSLNGIENLTELKSILLGNCRSLTSINEILNLDKLQKVQIESCPKINDLYLLKKIPTLEELKIWPKPV